MSINGSSWMKTSLFCGVRTHRTVRVRSAVAPVRMILTSQGQYLPYQSLGTSGEPNSQVVTPKVLTKSQPVL